MLSMYVCMYVCMYILYVRIHQQDLQFVTLFLYVCISSAEAARVSAGEVAAHAGVRRQVQIQRQESLPGTYFMCLCICMYVCMLNL